MFSSPTRQAQRTTEWRNSPNAYLKQEIEETGTPNPKKVTKVNKICREKNNFSFIYLFSGYQILV